MSVKFKYLDNADCILSDWINLIVGKRFTEADFRRHMRLRENDTSNFLYGITESGDLVGFIWAEYNSLEDTLHVNSIVLDPSRRKNPPLLKKVIEFLKEVVIILNIKSIRISSQHSKIFLREGCRPHPETLWIYENPHSQAHAPKHMVTRKERLSLAPQKENGCQNKKNARLILDQFATTTP